METLLKSITECFSSPDVSPTAIFWDGTDLYSCGDITNFIYQHTGFSSSITESFSSPSTTPAGVAFAGNSPLWEAYPGKEETS